MLQAEKVIVSGYEALKVKRKDFHIGVLYSSDAVMVDFSSIRKYLEQFGKVSLITNNGNYNIDLLFVPEGTPFIRTYNPDKISNELTSFFDEERWRYYNSKKIPIVYCSDSAYYEWDRYCLNNRQEYLTERIGDRNMSHPVLFLKREELINIIPQQDLINERITVTSNSFYRVNITDIPSNLLVISQATNKNNILPIVESYYNPSTLTYSTFSTPYKLYNIEGSFSKEMYGYAIGDVLTNTIINNLLITR